jgi:hypothetical protein
VNERQYRPAVGIFPSGLKIGDLKKEQVFKRRAIYVCFFEILIFRELLIAYIHLIQN